MNPANAVISKGLRRRHQRTKNLTATLLHFAFGAVGGAGFGLLSVPLPRAIPRPLAGMLYGTMTWLVSYMGWIPALRLMPPAQRDRSDRAVVMVLAHWIYGATMATVVDPLARRIPDSLSGDSEQNATPHARHLR